MTKNEKQMIERRDRMIAELKDQFPADLLAEYVSEVEHQDGYGYWLQFETAADMKADLDLYCQNIQE